MKKEIPYRKKQIYRSSDGRVVEAWEKMGTVTVDVEDDYEEDGLPDNVYIGIFPLLNPMFGIIEDHFDLGNPATLEEAFERWLPGAKARKEQYEKAQQKNERQIITAPESVLNQLDQLGNSQE